MTQQEQIQQQLDEKGKNTQAKHTVRTPVPTVGRMVHYVAYGTPGGEFKAGAHRAAVITDVRQNPDMARLCIFNPTGFFFSEWLVQDKTAQEPGTWHWPEFVPDIVTDE